MKRYSTILFLSGLLAQTCGASLFTPRLDTIKRFKQGAVAYLIGCTAGALIKPQKTHNFLWKKGVNSGFSEANQNASSALEKAVNNIVWAVTGSRFYTAYAYVRMKHIVQEEIKNNNSPNSIAYRFAPHAYDTSLRLRTGMCGGLISLCSFILIRSCFELMKTQ